MPVRKIWMSPKAERFWEILARNYAPEGDAPGTDAPGACSWSKNNLSGVIF